MRVLWNRLSGGRYSLGCPIGKKAGDFLLVVTVAVFEETGVLDMKHFAIRVDHYEDGKTKAFGIAKALHHLF